MNTALVISQSPQSKELIRSDMVAAKILQQAIKQGRGEEVLAGPSTTARTEGQASVEPKRVEALEQRPEAASVQKAPLKALPQPDYMADMREKIGDMTKALEGLKKAFEAMSGYHTMIMESDSATAIAFAGNVLGNVERSQEAEAANEAVVSDPVPADGTDVATDDGVAAENINGLKGTELGDYIVAEAGIVNRVESGSADDGIVARGEIVRHVAGGDGSDGVSVQARRAVDISGGSGDDAIAVEAETAWGISGGAGDDKMHVQGGRIGEIEGGSGDDKMSVRGLRVHDVFGGSGDDVMSITGKNITNVSDGAGDDTVTVVGDRLSGLQSSLGDDVYNLNVGSAKMSLREGMGNDVINLSQGTHVQFALGDETLMETGAASAVWDGDNLHLNFKNGDTLVINNAANAGSISMRAGDTMLTLMPPKTPAGEGILDIAV